MTIPKVLATAGFVLHEWLIPRSPEDAETWHQADGVLIVVWDRVAGLATVWRWVPDDPATTHYIQVGQARTPEMLAGLLVKATPAAPRPRPKQPPQSPKD